MLSRNGVFAIAAAISPYRAIRDEIRERHAGRFFEVFIDVPLEVAIQRDTKGLYKKALAGELKGFTGIDDPFEAPLDPELVIHTDQETPEASAERILSALRTLGYL